MLGNFSFGDYFKKEAIGWAWELLTDVYGLAPERLYATYFGGDDQCPCDDEAREIWLNYLPAERVLPFDARNATVKASTCFNELRVQRYAGKAALRARLLSAIANRGGFNEHAVAN